MKKIGSLVTVLCVLMVLVMPPKEVQARTPSSKAKGKSVASVDGFRSARFGMTEQQVLKSIFKVVKIPKSKIQRHVHPTEKTVSFNFQVKDLLPGSGKARLFYVMGFNSKRLIQINVIWSKAEDKTSSPQVVVDTANRLREHFLSQGFQKKGLVVNSKLPDGSVLVFRGVDRRGRMVVLLLVNPPPREGQAPHQNINLRLSYIQNPDSPDIYKIKKDDF